VGETLEGQGDPLDGVRLSEGRPPRRDDHPPAAVGHGPGDLRHDGVEVADQVEDPHAVHLLDHGVAERKARGVGGDDPPPEPAERVAQHAQGDVDAANRDAAPRQPRRDGAGADADLERRAPGVEARRQEGGMMVGALLAPAGGVVRVGHAIERERASGPRADEAGAVGGAVHGRQ
jgi:hypothetical protein